MWLFRARRNQRAETSPTISPAELNHRLDSGVLTAVLDVRQPNAYADHPGAIPGSIRIPPSELPNRYGELPRDRLIVPYCT